MMTKSDSSWLQIHPEINAALSERRPVVALESAVITHGLPRPINLELARRMQAEVRKANALPAITAVIDGVANLTGQTAVAYGFAWIPTEDADYKNNNFGFYKNTKMNTGGNADSFSDVFNVQLTTLPDPTLRTGYGVDGAVMNVQNVLFEKTGASQITFSADFIPSADLTTFFDARDIIWE